MGYRIYVDQLLAERKRRAPAPRRRGAAAPRRHGRATCCRTSRRRSRARRTRSASRLHPRDTTHLRAARFRAARRRQAARRRRLRRRPHLAQGDRADGRVRTRRAAAGGELPEPASSRGARSLDVRQAVLERLREERTLYDELMARALRLASTTFEDIEREPTVFIQGTSLLLEDVGGEDPELTLATLAHAAADDRGEDAPGAAARRLHGRRRPDGRHRHRAPRARPAALQRGRVDLLRRARHGRRRRHRADADALFARHQRRRQPVESHHAGWSIQSHEPRTTDIRDDDSDEITQTSRRPDTRARRPARSRRRRRRSSSGSATSTTICCCARRPSSTTTGSGSTASGRAVGDAAAADLIEELLPLVDDLERALKADAGQRRRRGVSAAASS